MARFVVRPDKRTSFYSVEDQVVTEEINKEGHWKCVGAYLTHDQAVTVATTLNYVLEMK
jgi:hypothetical protein